MEKCFGFRSNGCQVLYDSVCNGCNGNCHFYATDAQVAQNRYNANCRISTLLPNQQIDIADKYYNGYMPWRVGGGR